MQQKALNSTAIDHIVKPVRSPVWRCYSIPIMYRIELNDITFFNCQWHHGKILRTHFNIKQILFSNKITIDNPPSSQLRHLPSITNTNQLSDDISIFITDLRTLYIIFSPVLQLILSEWFFFQGRLHHWAHQLQLRLTPTLNPSISWPLQRAPLLIKFASATPFAMKGTGCG